MSGGGVLRAAVLGLGAAMIGGGLLLTRAGCGLGAGLRLAVPGLLLIAAIIGERWRYRRLQTARPGPEWLATDERFVDPESGRQVTVFYRKSTGERRYVGS
jgi:hypothetical protein